MATNSTRRVRFRQVSSQWLATVYIALISLGLSILLARQMGPESFGTYYYALGIATILSLFQSAGFPTLLMRERIAPTPALAALTPRLPGLALGHLLMASAAMILGAIALMPLRDAARLSCGILCFGAIVLSLQISAQLKSAGSFGREARWQIYGRTLSALLIVAVALTPNPNPNAVFLAWGIGLLLTYGLFPLKRDRLRPLFRLEGRVYRATLGLLWIELATNIYHRIDIVILHHLLGDAPEVGHYAAACRLFDGVLLLITPVVLILFRELRLRQHDAKALQKLSTKALLVALALGILLAAAGYLRGPVMASAIFGDQYAGSPVNWLFLAFVFVVPNAVLTQSAIAANQEKWYGICAGFAALLNIALNFSLIPAYGSIGSAWATLATEAGLGGALCLGMLRRGILTGKRLRFPQPGS